MVRLLFADAGCNMPIQITPDKFQNWLTLAPTGERMTYFKGHLGSERFRGDEANGYFPIDPDDRIARMAYAAHKRGSVRLFQKRNPEGSCDYLVYKVR